MKTYADEGTRRTDRNVCARFEAVTQNQLIWSVLMRCHLLSTRFILLCILLTGQLVCAQWKPDLGCLKDPGHCLGSRDNIPVEVAAKELNPYLEANQPVIRDYNTVYQHVNELPGAAFRPVRLSQSSWSKSFANSGYQTISLLPGDYSIPLQHYCMHFAGGSGPGFTYLLGPFRGTRARMISVLIGKGSGESVQSHQLQVLAWGTPGGSQLRKARSWQPGAL